MLSLLRVLVAAILITTVGSVSWAQLHQGVSLMSLVVSPAKFIGERVAVTGYLDGSGVPPYLYFSKERSFLHDAPNSIVAYETVDGRRMNEIERCLNRYVTVIGTFKKLEIGGAGITDIYRVVSFTEPSKRADSRICFSADD